MRENRSSHLVGWKTHPTIAPAGDRTHDLPHTVASIMVNVSHALPHSATAAVKFGMRISKSAKYAEDT